MANVASGLMTYKSQPVDYTAQPAVIQIYTSAGAGRKLQNIAPAGAASRAIPDKPLGELPAVRQAVAVRLVVERPEVLDGVIRRDAVAGCDHTPALG